MEIYILRDGTQMGPFSEETTQRLLKQGTVASGDLAWCNGMAQWVPLEEVLSPGNAQGRSADSLALGPTPAIPSVSTPLPARPPSEPASPRQKAFLSYIGIAFADDINKENAALLVNDAMENPKDPARVARWSEDRLRLHPDLYATEIQAKRENRSKRFFELAETEGSDCFEGLSKAHCQVLVGFLDVKYPNWDAKESEATWNYFFPAIAEKFPDVVRKEWRSKLKYPTGPKVAAELKAHGNANGTRKQRTSPVMAMLAGLVMGTAVIALVAGAIYLAKHPAVPAIPTNRTVPTDSTAKNAVQSPAPVKVAAAPRSVVPPEVAPGPPPDSSGPGSLDASTIAEANAAPEKADGSKSATIAPEGAPDGTPGVASTSGESATDPKANLPASGPGSLDSLFGTPAATPAPGGAPRKGDVVLTKAVEVPVPFGKAKLPAGTHLRVVSQEGATMKVNYLNQIVSIPASSTDASDTQ